MNNRPQNQIRNNVAVLSADQGNNYRATVNCLHKLGYNPIQLSPFTIGILKEQLDCPYLIVQGHSSDFGLYSKIRDVYDGVVINYWQGSDVYNTFKNIRRLLRVKTSQKFINRNWAVAERLVSDLKNLKIKASFVPQYVYGGIQQSAVGIKHKGVLVYYPDTTGRQSMSSFELYGIDKAMELAAHLPDFSFYFVGGGVITTRLPNIQFCGKLNDLGPIWQNVDYYFRATKSDGMPKMILEALEYGVLPISNYKYFENIWIFENVIDIATKMRSFENYELDIFNLDTEVKEKHGYESVRRTYQSELQIKT